MRSPEQKFVKKGVEMYLLIRPNPILEIWNFGKRSSVVFFKEI